MSEDKTPAPVEDFIFPASWTQAQRAEFIAAQEELNHEAGRIQELRAVDDSPEAAIAEKRAVVEKMRAERVRLERDKADDAIMADLVARHGGEHRVARIRTWEGSIFMRPQTEAEVDATDMRISKLTSDADKLKLIKESVAATIEAPPRPEFDAIARRYTHIWGTLFAARDRLNSGLAEDVRGKG